MCILSPRFFKLYRQPRRGKALSSSIEERDIIKVYAPLVLMVASFDCYTLVTHDCAAKLLSIDSYCLRMCVCDLSSSP